jgi:hypothetical protein
MENGQWKSGLLTMRAKRSTLAEILGQISQE